ncbi:porin family protein [Pedobacter duraquae]|nr:porin family protein [Pedobacter duraquae]
MMKKLLLSMIAVAAIAFSTQAQTEKGKIMLGGNLAFDTQKSDAAGSKANTSFEVVPSVGYFVGNNIAVGTGVGYSYDKNVGTFRNQAFVVSPFGRYYANISESFKFFGQLSVPMEFGSSKVVDAAGNVGAKIGSSTQIGVAVSPGFAFFPTKKIGIEFALNGLSYTNYKVDDNNGNKINGAGYNNVSFGTNFFSPKLGVQFYF